MVCKFLKWLFFFWFIGCDLIFKVFSLGRGVVCLKYVKKSGFLKISFWYLCKEVVEILFIVFFYLCVWILYCLVFWEIFVVVVRRVEIVCLRFW